MDEQTRETSNRRKQTVETIRFYVSDLEALLALPDEQTKSALEYLLDCHKKFNHREANRNIPPTDVPENLKNAKRLLLHLAVNMLSDIEEYWKRAEQNAKNRQGRIDRK